MGHKSHQGCDNFVLLEFLNILEFHTKCQVSRTIFIFFKNYLEELLPTPRYFLMLVDAVSKDGTTEFHPPGPPPRGLCLGLTSHASLRCRLRQVGGIADCQKIPASWSLYSYIKTKN